MTIHDTEPEPSIVEAIQWDGSFDSFLAILEWSNLGKALNIREYEDGEADTTHLVLHTDESVRVEPGMWIIRQSDGRFHSSASYEPSTAAR